MRRSSRRNASSLRLDLARLEALRRIRVLAGALAVLVVCGCAPQRAIEPGSKELGSKEARARPEVSASRRGSAALDAGLVRGRVQIGAYDFARAQKRAQKRVEYAFYVPTSYPLEGSESRNGTPLVVLLHGLGSTPERVLRYAGVIEQAEKRGYLLVAPLGYNNRGWYGSLGPGLPKIPGVNRPLTRPEDPENLGELSELDVWNVLELAQKRFRVDRRRIYLMGHSMGGGGSFHLAMQRPQLFAAVAPLAPAIYGDPSRVRAMRSLPVMVVQGEKDRLVRVENTRRWVEEMRSIGMQVRYVEIPGGDHTVSIARNPEMIAEVFDFFDRHIRTPRDTSGRALRP